MGRSGAWACLASCSTGSGNSFGCSFDVPAGLPGFSVGLAEKTDGKLARKPWRTREEEWTVAALPGGEGAEDARLPQSSATLVRQVEQIG